MAAVPDTPKTEAIARLRAGVDAVLQTGMVPADAAEARRLLTDLEVEARRLRAAQVELVDEIDRAGLHAVDAHASAKVMARHVCNLSGPEANRRGRAAKVRRDLPAVWTALRAGRIGGCQVDRIGVALANPRVHDAVVANEGSFAHQAEAVSFHELNLMITDWVRVVDEDGTRDKNQRSHEKRDAKLHQDFDGTWSLTGGCASLQGVELNTILKKFVEAEFLSDWAKVRKEHGDKATTAHLPRTDAQRRFDALLAIFQRAADAHAVSPGGSRIVTDVVIDQDTFERLAAILAGGTVEEPDPLFSSFPARKYRCSTLDGEPVEATEAVAQALVGHIRRVVIGSDSVVIDLGRERRLFTGAAALAVKLSQTTCSWPGCLVPVTQCQCDHVEPWTERADGRGGGCTCPGNGASCCGRHNREKERGYTVHRDAHGRWHTHRPDGTELE